MISDADLARLGALIRSHIPSCSSAVVVGSAVVDRGGCIGDIDVTGFDPTVEVGHDRSHHVPFVSLPVHVVLYNPLHFLALGSQRSLVFIFLREIRKLLEGVMLFDDDGMMGRSLDALRNVRPPHEFLTPSVRAVLEYEQGRGDTTQQRLAFYHAVENLAYAWMHFELQYRYTKPKWLIEDAKLVSPDLVGLLRGISLELTAAQPLRDLAAEGRVCAPAGESRAAEICVNNLADAEALLAEGREVEAVWPLRMAGFMLAQSWAETHELEYRDLRSVALVIREMLEKCVPAADLLQRLLLLASPPGVGLHRLWNRVRPKFLREWEAIEAGMQSTSGFKSPGRPSRRKSRG